AIGEIRRFALRGQADETAGQERQRTAAVGEDPANIRKLYCRSAEHDVRDGTRGIGGVFDRPRRDARNEAAAASRRGRVDVNDGLATVELFINRGKRRIAEIFVLIAGQQADPIRLERVQGVFDLLEASLHVEWGDDGEQAEPAGVISYELSGI